MREVTMPIAGRVKVTSIAKVEAWLEEKGVRVWKRGELVRIVFEMVEEVIERKGEEMKELNDPAVAMRMLQEKGFIDLLGVGDETRRAAKSVFEDEERDIDMRVPKSKLAMRNQTKVIKEYEGSIEDRTSAEQAFIKKAAEEMGKALEEKRRNR